MHVLRFVASRGRASYALCCLIGYLVFMALRPAAWAGGAACMVTYHLFLACLLYSSKVKRNETAYFGLPAMLAIHFGFIVVCTAARMAAVALVHNWAYSQPKELIGISLAIGARTIGVMTLVLVYGLVRSECQLLFGEKPAKNAKEQATVEMSARQRLREIALVAANRRDHVEWTEYYKRAGAKHSSAGLSPRDEFEQWLRERGKTQFPITANEVRITTQAGTVVRTRIHLI